MSCGYFSERKNCTEHDYAIFRTIERFPGSEMTKTLVARILGDFSAIFWIFHRENSTSIAAYMIHTPSYAAYFKVLSTKCLRLGTEIIISKTSKNPKKYLFLAKKSVFGN